MKQTRILWDMPITIEIVDAGSTDRDIADIYHYFEWVDDTFSVFNQDSEIMRINRGDLPKEKQSKEVTEVFSLCEQTKRATDGYFDIRHDDMLDPTGLVKGWAVYQAGKMLQAKGFRNYSLDAGGDIQVAGKNSEGNFWSVGIRNPFDRYENVKVLILEDKGIATSGTYIRGHHIYDPHHTGKMAEIVSLTVIGPNIYEADRFATPAFAMGSDGIHFIEKLSGFEGYMIDRNGIATYTSGFERYVLKNKSTGIPTPRGTNTFSTSAL